MKYKDYNFTNGEESHVHRLFMPPLIELCGPLNNSIRVLDIGCGNGYTAGEFVKRGCSVVGIDPSETGINIARENHPMARFEIMSADPHALQKLDEPPFDIVICTEVIEHLYAPQELVHAAYQALKPGGLFICSTPYHGYLKNLVLSLFNLWDQHANPLWDGGHIKFWSKRTLSRLLLDNQFRNIQFRGTGRLPFLWMTMLLAASKPINANHA